MLVLLSVFRKGSRPIFFVQYSSQISVVVHLLYFLSIQQCWHCTGTPLLYSLILCSSEIFNKETCNMKILPLSIGIIKWWFCLKKIFYQVFMLRNISQCKKYVVKHIFWTFCEYISFFIIWRKKKSVPAKNWMINGTPLHEILLTR